MKIIAGHELTWAAGQYAGREALVFGDRRVSYDEIEERSNRLANGLLGLGLASGERVAVLMSNSIESVETVFGVTKAGLAYVALNARHTAAEHAAILADAGVSAVIAGPEFGEVAQKAVASAPQVRRLIGYAPDAGMIAYETLLKDASPDFPAIEVDDSATTRIIYTSGTTGKPKGIRYSYARARQRQDNFFAALEYRLGVQDSMIHVGPLTHAAGNYLLPYFLRGARNIIFARFDPQHLLQTVEAERVTHLLLVPTMIARIVDHMEQGGHRYDLSSLSCINYGTASTPAHLLRRAVAHFGPIFRQHFGMSEAPQPLTVLHSHEHVLEGDGAERLASCGRPTMNVRITIRDEHGAELPPRENGEIAIAASGVADVEYWNRPGLREETVRNGWFYTGDVGWMDEQGFLYIVGRNKDMIITGGFNVFAREVEDALQQNPDVVEAAVTGMPDSEWGEIVVAAVVTRPGVSPAPDAVAAGCRDYIAGYKTPRKVVFVEALPRNVAGKVNKEELKRRLVEELGIQIAGA